MDEIDKNKLHDGRTYKQIYMTTFIQHLIDIGMKVKAIPVRREWVEIDTPKDIEVAENWIKETDFLI